MSQSTRTATLYDETKIHPISMITGCRALRYEERSIRGEHSNTLKI